MNLDLNIHKQNSQTPDPNFVSKTDSDGFLIPLLMAAFPIGGGLYALFTNPEDEVKEFSKHPVGLSIMIAFFVLLFLFFCYKYFFDTKEKLIINKDGVWTPKYRLVLWTSVLYIYERETRGKITSRTIFLKLKENERRSEIKINIDYLDKTEDQIIRALKNCSGNYNIPFHEQLIEKVF